MTTYSLGSGDPELSRLEAQAELLRRPTRLLLEASGIGPGMRVLDLGTGLGHVARAVAEIVGPTGEVVGIDLDPRMIAAARARSSGLANVRFAEGDVAQWGGDDEYDALVGRLILFHVPDPVGVLRHHLQAVRRGGRVVMIDYDIGGLRAEPSVPLVERMSGLMMAAFRAAGADPTIGSRLATILAEAGVEDRDGFAIAEYLASDNPIGPMLLTGVIRALAPAMVAHGLATEEELGLDTLAARLATSLREGGAVMVPPILAGAWGRRT